MSTGLVALLDDVAALARMAATSLDDVAAQAMKAGTKSAGVVVDDAAVTPRYVVGLSPSRELPMIARITVGSLKNKLVFLLPGALVLSFIAPWLITPILMLGGGYLCYEGAEKIYELLAPDAAHAHEDKAGAAPTDPVELENSKVTSAIRTDLILSAEIMAIALSTIADAGLVTQAVVLAIVGLAITLVVYGSVALIVKADDVGLVLARNEWRSPLGALVRAIGRGLVGGMPYFLTALSAVGTAAMIWVGGGILVHGVATFGWHDPERLIETVAAAAAAAVGGAPGLVRFLVGAVGSGLIGLAAGAVLIPIVGKLIAPSAAWVRGRLGRS